jgi:hypothetical protein
LTPLRVHFSLVKALWALTNPNPFHRPLDPPRRHHHRDPSRHAASESVEGGGSFMRQSISSSSNVGTFGQRSCDLESLVLESELAAAAPRQQGEDVISRHYDLVI